MMLATASIAADHALSAPAGETDLVCELLILAPPIGLIATRGSALRPPMASSRSARAMMGSAQSW